MLDRFKDNKISPFSCEEIEKAIRSLSTYLGNEWLTVYPLGKGSISIKVGDKKSQGLSLFSVVIPLGVALSTLGELKGFQRLVEKLNVQSNERLSTILEAMCASRYKMKGYEIELEPSTQEGKYSDFRVKYEGEWIYFECKKEYPQESKYYKNLDKYANEITGKILKTLKSKIPSNRRIDIILSNRVQEKTLKSVIARLSLCLDNQECNLWQEINGIKFAVNSRETKVDLPSGLYVSQAEITVGTKPTRVGEESAHFQIIYRPFGIRHLQRVRRLIKKANDQIPKMSRGVIVLETLYPKMMLKIAEEKLNEPRYGHLIAILVTGYEAWYVPNLRHLDIPSSFLKIAVG